MQTQQLKLLLYRQTLSCLQTDSSVKSATRVSKETKICSCTVEGTIFHGSSGKEPALKLEREFMFAQNLHVSTTTQLVL